MICGLTPKNYNRPCGPGCTLAQPATPATTAAMAIASFVVCRIAISCSLNLPAVPRRRRAAVTIVGMRRLRGVDVYPESRACAEMKHPKKNPGHQAPVGVAALGAYES